MLFFVNDYGYGAHPKVLEHLTETNMQPLTGYGNDEITASAAEKIKAACACPEGQVYFLTGGTQTNTSSSTRCCVRMRALSRPPAAM